MKNLLLAINTDALLKALEITWKGLLAIVIVVGIIIAVTYFLLFLTNRKSKKSDTEKDE